MKTIICYGVKNQRLRGKLQSFLSNEYKIIGFSDSYCDEDCLQGEAFIPVEELISTPADYILVMAEKQSTQDEIIKMLSELGIPIDRMVIPSYLIQENILYTPNLLEEALLELEQREINGVICGLSYSLLGIDEKNLRGNFVDISWYGLDIYYNCKICSQIIERKDIDKIMFVFPYWYFDYDMSLSLYQYTSAQIFACRSMKDWHNAPQAQDMQIRNYLINDAMFGDKLWDYKKWKKHCMKDTSIVNGKHPISSLWKNTYTDTRSENLKTFTQLLEKLDNADKYLIIPPMSVSNVVSEEVQYINLKKNIFYEYIEKLKAAYPIKVFDYLDLFDSKYFFDNHHLNEQGKQKFTEIINRDILCR